jgi:hypothetical protein
MELVNYLEGLTEALKIKLVLEQIVLSVSVLRTIAVVDLVVRSIQVSPKSLCEESLNHLRHNRANTSADCICKGP